METEFKSKRTPTSYSQRSTEVIKKQIIQQPLNKTSPFILQSKSHSKQFSNDENRNENKEQRTLKNNQQNIKVNNSIFVQHEDCSPNDKNHFEYQQFQTNQEVKSHKFQKLFDSSTTEPNQVVGIDRFDGVEASLTDSINMFKNLEKQNQENPAGTLFSFLHCFPPSTILKIIPTQQAVKKLIDKDNGKLAVVPTEVLLDMKESRQFLQGLVESQKQVIQLLQKELHREKEGQRLNVQIREQNNRAQTNMDNSSNENHSCPVQ